MTKRESKKWLDKLTSTLDLLQKDFPNDAPRILLDIEDMLAPPNTQTNIQQALGE